MTNGIPEDEPTGPTELPPGGLSATPSANAVACWADRFERRGILGTGGMGVVFRVFDRHLEREVALKVIRRPFAEVLREARTGGRLEHPGVVSVYDAGALPQGGGWLAMRLVRGRDLTTVFEAIRSAGEVWPRRRLVAALLQVAQAMGYAHSEGVMHLDLKPANIRLGAFGEVVILDWGIAGRARSDVPLAGTPGFAAPERLEGAPPTPRADVYALGRILGLMMSHSADDEADDGLRALRDRAAAIIPARRPRDAAAFAAELQAWLDGSMRRAEAAALLAQGEPLLAEAARAREGAEGLRREATRVLAPLEPWAPADEKARGWALEAKADGLDAAADQLTLEAEQHLGAALQRAPLPAARHRLGALLRDRLLAAEARRDGASVAEHAARLRALDPEAHASFLAGDGRLTLRTTPPGAAVYLAPYQHTMRRLELGPEVRLGRTPLTAISIPRGSHRLRIEAPGCAPVHLPVSVAREAHVAEVPPGATEPASLWLPPADALGPDECYVPGGWFDSGGDPFAVDGLPSQRIWIDGFVIERHPLTYARLLPALNALVEAGHAERAAAMAPAPFDPQGKASDGHVGLVRGDDGRYRLISTGAFDTPERWPVNQMSWTAAVAWARHEAEVSGQPWRLPHELEREKAARGADGRRLPWGDHFEPTWACTANSWQGAPTRAPVTAFPDDVSPYGVRGLAGNVRDWCANRFRIDTLPQGDRLVVALDEHLDGPRGIRGGAWGATPLMCHAAARYSGDPHGAFFFVGVRLVRPLTHALAS